MEGSSDDTPEIAGGGGMIGLGKRMALVLAATSAGGDRVRLNAREGSGALSAGRTGGRAPQIQDLCPRGERDWLCRIFGSWDRYAGL